MSKTRSAWAWRPVCRELRIDVGVVERLRSRQLPARLRTTACRCDPFAVRRLREICEQDQRQGRQRSAARPWPIDASIPWRPRGYRETDGCSYRRTHCPVGGGLSFPRAQKAQGPSLGSANGLCSAAWPEGGRQAFTRKVYAHPFRRPSRDSNAPHQRRRLLRSCATLRSANLIAAEVPAHRACYAHAAPTDRLRSQ